LCDRRDIYDEAMSYFASGGGNGALDKAVYFVHDGYLGQWQESGRDQGHTTLGIALMGPIMETAWNQGENWYGRDNNRFLAGAEYVAKYNLDHDVPYQFYARGRGPRGDREESPVISSAGRGHIRAGYELVINHYAKRRGIATPYSEQYAAKLRPEGGPGGHASSFDQLGFGTLTATRDPETGSPKPSGLTILKRQGKPVLSWWGALGADSYRVKRASTPGGPYATIATDVTDILTYTDEETASVPSYYVVTGLREGKETEPSNEVAFTAAPVLRAHLTFDEISGSSARNLSDPASPGILSDSAGRAEGSSGGAAALGRKDSSVTLPAGVMEGLSDFTIAAWVNLSSAPDWCRIFDFGDNRGQYMFLTPNRGGGLPRFEVTTVYGYNAQRIEGDSPLPLNRWVHVAVTLSGREGTLYIDGKKAGSNEEIDFAPFRLGRTTRNWIGRSQFDRDPALQGKVDDFRIYDGALSPGEIAALAAAKPAKGL
jgi:hypothetical protein